MRTITRFVLGVLVTLLSLPAALFLIAAVSSAISAINQPNPDIRSLEISTAFLSVSLAFALAIVPAFITLLMHIEYHLHRISDNMIDVSIATRAIRDMTFEEQRRAKHARSAGDTDLTR